MLATAGGTDGGSRGDSFRHLVLGDLQQTTRDQDLPIATESFDCVGCSLVVPYLFDPLSALREFYRVLRPGGSLVVSSPRRNFDPSAIYAEQAEILRQAGEDGEAALDGLRRFGSALGQIIELEEDGRFHFFEQDELAGLLRQAGFVDVRDFDGFGRPPVCSIARGRRPLR
jgi:SAM-dependent methyltransferase